MTNFISSTFSWIVCEFILSSVLYLIYQGLLKLKTQSGNRYLFLKSTFLALPFIPLLHFEFLFKPSLSDQRNVSDTLEAIFLSTHSATNSSHSSALLSWIILGIFTLYFLVLIRGFFRLLKSIIKLRTLIKQGERILLESEIPIILHNHELPPATIGILSPTILISRETYNSISKLQLDLIIQHEKHHIQRHDSFFNLIRILLQTLLFFSPLMSKLSHAFEEEMELSCDELVLSENHFRKKEYAALLIELATGIHLKTNFIYSGFFNSEPFITRRIQAMKSLSTIRPQPRLISALFITFFTLSAFGLSALGVDSKTKVDLSSINPQEKSEIAVSFDSVLAKAEKGDAEAQNKAGEMLHFGESVRPNYQAALKWYLKASEQGHPIAPNHIGRIYLNGEGVARDPKEAAKWYLLSAERGYAVAMYNIGSCYETGSGVPKNSAKAKEWFDRAEKTQPGIIQLIKQKKLN